MSARSRLAAGFVIFQDTAEGRRYLLLENHRHGTWGFPKGHCHADEGDLDCAYRELEEETGLSDIEIVPGFRDVSSYEVVSKSGKRRQKLVTLFLARLRSGTIRLSREHSTSRWVDVDEGVRILQWESLRETLRSAQAFGAP